MRGDERDTPPAGVRLTERTTFSWSVVGVLLTAASMASVALWQVKQHGEVLAEHDRKIERLQLQQQRCSDRLDAMGAPAVPLSSTPREE